MDLQLKKTLSEREEELKICTSCPSRQVLELLANRWKLLVIHASRMNDVTAAARSGSNGINASFSVVIPP